MTRVMTRVSNQTNNTDMNSVNSRVFVGNLNTYVVAKEDVEQIFKRYGRVIGISMHKGYAFVQFTDCYDARNAILGEDGQTVAGQILDVNMVSEPKPHQLIRKRQASPRSTPTETLTGLRQPVPPLKRLRTEALNFSLGSGRPRGRPVKLTKQALPLNSYCYSEPDILICGTCKQLFSGLQGLLDHKKEPCRLRFTCRCQDNGLLENAPATPTCAYCDAQCDTWWDLAYHLEAAHGIATYRHAEESESSVVDGGPGEDDHSQMSVSSPGESSSGPCEKKEVNGVNGDAVTEEGSISDHHQQHHCKMDVKEDKSVDTKDLLSDG